MPRQIVTTLVLPALVGGMAIAAPAWAQEENDPYARCAEMADDARRLGCFDTTYAEWQAERAERARLLVQDAQRAEARRAEEFGLSALEVEARRETEARADPLAAGELALLEEKKASESDFAVTATVTDASEDRYGKRTVRLDNGQVWRETSGSSMRLFIRPGWQASVTRRWSGGYEMRFDGHRGVLRVSRVQ
jgi:hypothetical protein